MQPAAYFIGGNVNQNSRNALLICFLCFWSNDSVECSYL